MGWINPSRAPRLIYYSGVSIFDFVFYEDVSLLAIDLLLATWVEF